jgi:hypothetical protein
MVQSSALCVLQMISVSVCVSLFTPGRRMESSGAAPLSLNPGLDGFVWSAPLLGLINFRKRTPVHIGGGRERERLDVWRRKIFLTLPRIEPIGRLPRSLVSVLNTVFRLFADEYEQNCGRCKFICAESLRVAKVQTNKHKISIT